MENRFTKGKSAILERPLARAKTEVSVSAFALLFSEMVQYCQSRVYSVAELQGRLADMGQGVGSSLLDVLVIREKNSKRETKVLNILLFVKILPATIKPSANKDLLMVAVSTSHEPHFSYEHVSALLLCKICIV
ncbi:trafficking protein particle complex subunit 5 [Tachysurus ichikawai]